MPDRNVPFSIREGIVTEKIMQTDEMDDELRNSLWNVMYSHIFQKSVANSADSYDAIIGNTPLERITKKIWGDFFRAPLDEIKHYRDSFLKKQFKPYFLDCPWHKAYECVEFIAQNYEFENTSEYQEFEKDCNIVLVREKSGYRLIGKSLVKITNDDEIQSIKDASSTPLDSVNTQIESAKTLLSDKTNPDYRNSIKDSIGAVESLCKKIVGDDDTTLGRALTKIQTEGTIEIHEQMKDAFKKLYGYTSDSGGIRHGLIDGEMEPDYDDAKFMLVSCSAFVNYLIMKSEKAGINLR